ncbi:aspartyl protease [Nannochloropsis oceanica]
MRVTTAVAAATTGIGLWLAAMGVVVEAADPVYMPLTYKPRTSARPAPAGGQWSTMAVGADGTQRPLPHILDLQIDLDAAGFLQGASVGIVTLQSLNPHLWAYFAPVLFLGDQIVDVLIDTGSAGLGVPIETPTNWTDKDFQKIDPFKAAAERIPCSDPRCRGSCDNPSGSHFCGPHGGSCARIDGEDVCTFAWLYGDGSSAAGVLLSAPVELGGRQANSTFGGIIRASDNFFEAPRGGGIMGLSFGGYSLCDSEFSCFPPLLDDIVRQCHLDDKFTVCAHGDDAVLILGGGDSRLYEGNVTYAPLQPPFGFYWVDVKDVQMAGETLVERSSPSFLSRLRQATTGRLSSASMTALVDTGNSAMYLPEQIFDNFKEQLQKILSPLPFPTLFDRQRSIFNGYAMYIAPELLAQMPPLVVMLDGGVNITIPSDQYTQEFRVPEVDVPLRALKIVRGGRFVLGQTALNHAYVEIDRSSKTIGFARSRPGCRPEGK